MEDDAAKIKFIGVTAEELDMLSELLVSFIKDKTSTYSEEVVL